MKNMDITRMVCIDLLIQIINFTTINHHTDQQNQQILEQYIYIYIYIYVCMYVYIYVGVQLV